ncbi:MAG: GNAT family N-acetyltransferase [Lachnospiraceae bacterium]|nr:GNAT family N-acetyltransferase [Lachnospiraceae bacterium]
MEPMNKDIVIRGQQIYLRPITVEDTEMVVRWRNLPVVVKNFIYRKPVSCEDHENWLKNKVFKGLVHQFIVCRNEDDMPLGSIYLQNFEEENKKAEWGIYLGEEQAYGKGIGTEAAKLVLDYAFTTLGMHKVVSRVLERNKASIRMNEKAGYVREAYLKEELFLDGQYEDLILFGAINPGDKRV